MDAVTFNDTGMNRVVIHVTEDGEKTLCGRTIMLGDDRWAAYTGEKIKYSLYCKGCTSVIDKLNAPTKEAKASPKMYMGHRLTR